MNGLREYGRALITNGYQIVPIKPGTKNPNMPGWQNLRATVKHLNGWLANGRANDGVGVLTANTPCVDIDVLDADMAEIMRQKVCALVGDTPYRTGKAPKMALFFRTDKPFRKVSSARFRSPNGDMHRIEILGEGQQSVLYAVHPETEKEYTWQGGTLAEIRHEDLPLLTLETARMIVAVFEHLAQEAGWEKVESAPSSGAESSDSFLDHLKPPVGDEKRIKAALARISADCDYHRWVRVGMGLHHEYKGGEAGFALWDEWSSGGATYPGTRECRQKWRTFEANLNNTDPVTAASILMLAKEDDPLTDFLRRYVYVERGDCVADLDKPPQHSISRYHEWKNQVANVRTEVPAPTQKDPDRTKLVSVSALWMNDEARCSAQGTVYRPGGGRIVRKDSLQWVNTFYMPEHAPSTADISLFHNHLAYLVPDEADRKWLIAWLARIIQRPYERSRVSPLHISHSHGTGRGWLLRLIEMLVGAHNVSRTSMRDFVDGNFNEFLADCLVCAIEEVRDRSNRFELNDKVKDKFEAPRLTINRKYGAKYTLDIYASVLMFSNHTDALALEPNDRRCYVMFGAEHLQDAAYFKRLYDALNAPDFVAAVYHYLKNLDISTANFERSADNEARRRLIQASQSDTEMVFRAVMAAPPFAAMRLNDFVDLCRKEAQEQGIDPFELNEKQIAALLTAEGCVLHNFSYKNKTTRAWALVREAYNDRNLVRKALDEQ